MNKKTSFVLCLYIAAFIGVFTGMYFLTNSLIDRDQITAAWVTLLVSIIAETIIAFRINRIINQINRAMEQDLWRNHEIR